MTDVQAPACIFCGGETRIDSMGDYKSFFVECDDSECWGSGPYRPTRAEAVAAFLRPVAEARRKALEEARTLCKAIVRVYDDEAYEKFMRPGEFTAGAKSSAAEECEEAIRALMPAPEPAAPEAVDKVKGAGEYQFLLGKEKSNA